jgi:hypothetical protein
LDFGQKKEELRKTDYTLIVIEKSENQFTQFRLQLYQHFNNRNDTLMDLVDALCSDTQARSVVELSLNPVFRRDYNSLYKAITEYCPQTAKLNLAELAAGFLPLSPPSKYWLLGIDTTSCSRPYAFKLAERECVYQPTPIKDQKPITYGHQYSEVCLLEGKKNPLCPAWVIPLSTQRVSRASQEQMGITQTHSLLKDARLPFHQKLCLLVGDSKYSTPSNLAANGEQSNLVTITRSRSNRVYCFQAENNRLGKGRHPKWHGRRMDLKDPQAEPDEKLTHKEVNQRGKVHRVEIEGWHNLLMREKYKPVRLHMHRYPFTLVRIRVYNDQAELVYPHPLWLIVMGQRRQELSLSEIYAAFQERSNMEHFFRFTKQKLLLDAFQTPETTHEEHWWMIAHLAYLQLWIARRLAVNLPHPWERYLPQSIEKPLSPAMVQRSFSRIIRQLGTPAVSPQRRGYSPGRPRGKIAVRRKDFPLAVAHSN